MSRPVALPITLHLFNKKGDIIATAGGSVEILEDLTLMVRPKQCTADKTGDLYGLRIVGTHVSTRIKEITHVTKGTPVTVSSFPISIASPPERAL